MSVIRLTRAMCAAVSLPLPDKFNQTIRLLSITFSEDKPLGETLTVPVSAAVATKNIGWRSMNEIKVELSALAVAIDGMVHNMNKIARLIFDSLLLA